MKSYKINANDANQRLDKFLFKVIPNLGSTLMYKYIRIKRIKVNGKRCEINYRLEKDDFVECYINDEFFEGKRIPDFLKISGEIDVVYEDKNILLINKPQGLVVHEDDEKTKDTAINRILKYLYDKQEYNPEEENSFTPALCNRIDRNTSGIVIAAKNADALRFMNLIIKEREIKKYYLCVLDGILFPTQDTLTHYHWKDEEKNQVYVSDRPSAKTKTMVTQYKILKTSRKNSLAEVLLVTGRTHQIRAHLAHVGHPIIGDGKYGFRATNEKYKLTEQLLCSHRLILDFSRDDSNFNYLKGKEFIIKNIWFADEFQQRF